MILEMGGSTCMPHFWAMKSMEGTNVLSQYHSFSNGRPTESGRHPYVQRMVFFSLFHHLDYCFVGMVAQPPPKF